MKSIYDITKGQLVVVWSFFILSALTTVDCGSICTSGESLLGLFSLLFPVFYTIGWRKKRKEDQKKT